MSKILLIDDDRAVRQMIRMTLAHAGYEVVEASNGLEGMDAIHREKVDLVITDLIMPEKEGLETIMDMKREDASTKIIAISGGGRGPADCYLEVAKKIGAAKVISKPFRSSELLDAVAELLA